MGTLSHLDELEAEAIYIMREVAAECEKPVMLYSIGKDSSVMAASGNESILPGKATVPIYAYRYNMEIQRNDRI